MTPRYIATGSPTMNVMTAANVLIKVVVVCIHAGVSFGTGAVPLLFKAAAAVEELVQGAARPWILAVPLFVQLETEW